MPRDFAKAAEYYQLAAEKGVPHSMMSLGLLCQAGKGVPQDPAQARSWLERAAVKGHEPAKAELERLTLSGQQRE